jgi:coproporphyrinogen III oxidase-like Fe-S oxidoreductase
VRWRETAELRPHLEPGGEPPVEREVLSLGQRQLEMVFLGLRQVRGIDAAAFAALGGGGLPAVAPGALRELLADGVLREVRGGAQPGSATGEGEKEQTLGWRVAPRHLLLADAVVERFAAEIAL